MAVPPIPRGIEILVKKAAIDPEFRELLLRDRTAAAQDIGLELDPSETMMLNAISTRQLEITIDNTTVSPKQRTAFMGKVAAVMLVALGATVLTGCPVSKGERPDRPPVEKEKTGPAEPDKPIPPPTRGVQPDRPERIVPSEGIKPDRPESKSE